MALDFSFTVSSQNLVVTHGPVSRPTPAIPEPPAVSSGELARASSAHAPLSPALLCLCFHSRASQDDE